MAKYDYSDVVNEAATRALEARGLATVLENIVEDLGTVEGISSSQMDQLHAVTRSLLRTCRDLAEILDPPPSAIIGGTTSNREVIQ